MLMHYFEQPDRHCGFPVDLVYAWVDGADPAWLERRKPYLKAQENSLVEDALCGRYDNHDELKYSLRSVAAFAPWINHIYIVTDRQTPDFLNLSHPKISLVDHTEIYDDLSVLPTFNSESIEWRLPFIPGLSEHFIYGNDDFFFHRPVSPSFFFMPDGKPVVRVWENRMFQRHRRWYADEVYRVLYESYAEIPWFQWMLRINKIIYDRFGILYANVPYHGFDPYLKSNFLSVMSEPWLKDGIASTVASRFRSAADLDRHIVALVDNIRGRNTLIMRRRYERYLKFLRFPYEFQIVDNERNMDRMSHWLRPYQFCVYDGARCTRSYLQRIQSFLENLFPEKCEFEK